MKLTYLCCCTWKYVSCWWQAQSELVMVQFRLSPQFRARSHTSTHQTLHVAHNIRSARFRVLCAAQSTHAQSAAARQQQAAVPTTTSPTWSSFVSRRINIELAIEEAIEGARKGLAEDWEPELAVVFLSSAYVQEYGSLVDTLRSKLPSLKYIAGSTVRRLRVDQHAACTSCAQSHQQPALLSHEAVF
jgi:hypothetical protein